MAQYIFLDMIIASSKENCTIWPYGKTCHGYGAVCIDGRNCSTHVASWEIYHNQEVPKGYFVCHSCDVKPCFNPFHLFLGTPKGNMEDKVNKCRQARGSHHGMARLKEEDVRKIRQLYPYFNQRQIGDMFGVARDTIGNIVRGDSWTHLL